MALNIFLRSHLCCAYLVDDVYNQATESDSPQTADNFHGSM